MGPDAVITGKGLGMHAKCALVIKWSRLRERKAKLNLVAAAFVVVAAAILFQETD